MSNFERTDWLDENGAFSMLYRLHPIRMKWLSDFNFEGQNVLDIGCGAGLVSKSIASLKAKVIGIDESLSAINSAKKQSEGFDVEYICASFESFEFHEKFDAITAFEVVEHVSDQTLFFEKISRLLKPNGTFFMSTINRTIYSYLKAIIAAEYIFGIIPKGTHDFKKFLSPFEISQIMPDEMQVTCVNGMSFNFFKREFYLSNSTNTNFFLRAVKL